MQQITLCDFCEALSKLEGKTNAEKAVAILWYHDQKQSDICMTAGQLTKILDNHHLGTPNATQLAEAIKKTKFASDSKKGFTLKPGSRNLIVNWFPDGFDGVQPQIDHAAGFLPEAVWANTRGYIESVCRQINGCFLSAYYDAAAVLLRRLLETLIIEGYEYHKRESEIKKGNGDYFMLRDLVERACGDNGHQGLNLMRDSKSTLKEARDLGNWSAHARRYNAVRTDLKSLQAGIRLTVQDLIQIANLKRGSK